MIKNPELDLAFNFIEKTNRNVFLTGKAGTGKTTFLHKIKTESLKRMVVVAPTGVAAINAKGVTIHSFFQMPFGPILPDMVQSKENQRKFNRTKIDIIKSLDLVIIDEISMVRADLLDGIDQVLRRYKDKTKVFGGVQLLMIGDLQQLSPVVKPNEWNLLRNHYKTVYFFSSRAFLASNAISIELTHIYRQENQQFIGILNEIRNNQLSEASAKILNSRYHPDFVPSNNEGYITLTTHNHRADTINTLELNQLNQKSFSFNAIIEGKFNEYAYPTAQLLILKKGAQVMFIKNDSSPEKRYYNGKIGVITYINKKEITVQCPDDDFEIDVTPETWNNVSYTLNEKTKEITENVSGSFSQIPLRLAWAITIHKSQGLTFEKAIIDAEASFAHGQTYVALSRCTSLEGIVLKTKIKDSSIISDSTIKTFTKTVEENRPDKAVLLASEKAYHFQLIEDLFNYRPFLYPVNRLIDIFYRNRTSLQGNIIEQLQTVKDKGVVPLLQVANGFKNQLQTLSIDISQLEESDIIQERFKKAVAYFSTQTNLHIKEPLEALTFSTENKTVKKDFEKQLKNLQDALSIKTTCLTVLVDGFNASTYLKTRAKAVLETPKKTPKVYEITTEHASLFEELKSFRKDISDDDGIPPFQVFTQKTLHEMCDKLPTTKKQLLAINGMGKIRVQKYGEPILQLISSYCKMNEITPKKDSKSPEKTAKTPTKELSLQLFKSGLTIEEIATKREFTTGTILGHLTTFIATGELTVFDLIPEKRFKKIEKAIKKVKYESLSELKEKVDPDFSYAELRMVLATLK